MKGWGWRGVAGRPKAGGDPGVAAGPGPGAEPVPGVCGSIRRCRGSRRGRWVRAAEGGFGLEGVPPRSRCPATCSGRVVWVSVPGAGVRVPAEMEREDLFVTMDRAPAPDGQQSRGVRQRSGSRCRPPLCGAVKGSAPEKVSVLLDRASRLPLIYTPRTLRLIVLRGH